MNRFLLLLWHYKLFKTYRNGCLEPPLESKILLAQLLLFYRFTSVSFFSRSS